MVYLYLWSSNLTQVEFEVYSEGLGLRSAPSNCLSLLTPFAVFLNISKIST